MKKTFKASVVVAFIITIGLFLIETVAVVAFKKLPISLRLSGGDSVTIFGIGWKNAKIYHFIVLGKKELSSIIPSRECLVFLDKNFH